MTLSIVSAHRAEFLSAHGATNTPDPVSLIEKIEEAKAPPTTIEEVAARFAALAEPEPMEEGGDDATRID